MKIQRKINLPIIFVILTILLLDFAALDDITTGNEPNFYGEYLIIFASFVFFGYLIGKDWQINAYKLQKRITQNTFLKHYHIHHTLIGIILVLAGLLLKSHWAGTIITGFGLGLFLHGIISNGLHFIILEK